MDRHPTVFVVEHSNEFEARAERVEVLAQCRHAHVVGVLELGDRTLGDVEPAGEFGLADRLLALGSDPITALHLARDLTEALDGEQQIWLLGWWQLSLWRQLRRPEQLRRLEKLRSQLRSYVQPRLAWEVALLELADPAS